MVLVTAASGCERVVRPDDLDDSPLKTLWNIHNLETGEITEESSLDITARPGETLRVVFKALDPDGVESVRFHGDAGGTRVVCERRGVRSERVIPHEDELSTSKPDSEGKVPTMMFLLRNLTPDTQCPIFSSHVETVVILHATGRNYGWENVGTLKVVVR